jgi:predicted DCC family thiol-disulfide oxidoreductase YuxK
MLAKHEPSAQGGFRAVKNEHGHYTVEYTGINRQQRRTCAALARSRQTKKRKALNKMLADLGLAQQQE